MSRTPDVLEQTVSDREAHLQLQVPHDLVYTDGHFEGEPIVPGVVLLDWALEIARDVYPSLKKLSEIRSIKFKRSLQPGDQCELELHRNSSSSAISFTYHRRDRICAEAECRFGDT